MGPPARPQRLLTCMRHSFFFMATFSMTQWSRDHSRSLGLRFDWCNFVDFFCELRLPRCSVCEEYFCAYFVCRDWKTLPQCLLKQKRVWHRLQTLVWCHQCKAHRNQAPLLVAALPALPAGPTVRLAQQDTAVFRKKMPYKTSMTVWRLTLTKSVNLKVKTRDYAEKSKPHRRWLPARFPT